RDGKRANGRDGLLVKNRCPTVPAVRRFPNAARRRPRVVRAGISRHPSNGGNAIPNSRSDKAKSKLAILVCVRLLSVCRRNPTQDHQQREASLSVSDKL